ncbi:alpha/beta fold hydrolase [Lichenibacterium dinghuense]|uniref:alpha/beta fold hydrolase n=1 Tax=Lichenibacterium dinghuense TaxID=2895977 RepID=UPI001F267188|nr:alpha/beta hydrolase [Lichenibacterium sp. 6Y81]
MTDVADRFATSSDGLRLHYRDVGRGAAGALPVVCLPGLTRTAADFEVLAAHLAGGGADGPPRRVLSLDYRGRGGSDHDPDPSHYSVPVEAGDVLAVLHDAGVPEAVFVGTSRGGLITMVLSTVRPEMIRGAVLNDIGPVLEPAGLERIRGYVGRLPPPRDWDDAVRTIKGYAGPQFPGLSEADWLHFARTTYAERDGTLVGRYDPALVEALRALDPAAPLPTLWPQFDGLAGVPVLVVRGACTDLLSEATAAEMVRRHPDCAPLTVPGQGHAPLLIDAPTLARIAAFASRCDGAPPAPPLR